MESRQQVWNLADAVKQTWVAEVCPSWQRHLSSWCYNKPFLLLLEIWYGLMFVLLGLPLNVFGVLHSFYVWSYVESILGLSPYFVCFWINPVRSKSSQFLALVWFGFFFLLSFLWFKGVFGKHPLGLFLVVFISRKIFFFANMAFEKTKKI